MIDLYQMASLAGISGSWRTDGEMLWWVFFRPLSSPSRKDEGLLNAERAGGESGSGERMGMRGGRKALTLSLKVTAPQGGSRERKKKTREGDGWNLVRGKK